MKRAAFSIAVAVAAAFAVSAGATLTAQNNKPKKGCTTIQSGTLSDSLGNQLVLGFDEFGYNYQAHEFNGTYDSSDRKLDGKYWGIVADYVDDRLIMKWSDDWISNVDCNGDGKLDRGIDGISRGWLTNQIEGDYDSDGDSTQDAHYTEFVKFGWVGPGGSIWGQYDILQDVYNDPVGGYNGIYDKLPSPGFGLNDHWTE